MQQVKVDGIDREVSGIATATMHRAYLRGIRDVNEITVSAFLTFENAVACEVYSHFAKVMPYEPDQK